MLLYSHEQGAYPVRWTRVLLLVLSTIFYRFVSELLLCFGTT